MTSWLDSFYKMLYTKFGGRQWTDIIRDEQKTNPLFFMLLFLFLGVVVVKVTKEKWWLAVIWLALGIIIGHFWW